MVFRRKFNFSIFFSCRLLPWTDCIYYSVRKVGELELTEIFILDFFHSNRPWTPETSPSGVPSFFKSPGRQFAESFQTICYIFWTLSNRVSFNGFFQSLGTTKGFTKIVGEDLLSVQVHWRATTLCLYIATIFLLLHSIFQTGRLLVTVWFCGTFYGVEHLWIKKPMVWYCYYFNLLIFDHGFSGSSRLDNWSFAYTR